MARKTKEELNAIKAKFGVNELWSWSKFNTYKNSKYEYFLKYILHKKEDRTNGAYSAYGTLCHDTLEKFYLGEIRYEDIYSEFNDGLIVLDLADLKFDRASEEKNQSVKSNYLSAVTHFMKNHTKIEEKTDVERFITVSVGDNLFQGYIDMVRKDSDGNVIIQDWKSSTIYRGEKAIKEAGQLILYAEGIRQLGVPLEKIKICWNFLKYCTVTQTQAKGNTSNRNIERIKLGESLKSNAKMWLKKLGYTDEINDYLDLLSQTNSIECLPQDVQEKYKVDDCYVFVDLTEDLINDLKLEILNTIKEIKQKELEYKQNKDESIWYDTEEDVKKQSFYFANLCGYSADLHKPYKKYIDEYNAKKENKDNIFANSEASEEDLAWLDLV